MKRIIVGSVTLLSIFTLVGCSSNEKTSTEKPKENKVEVKEKPTSHNLKFGNSYTFTKKDFETTGYDNVGLRMTVQKPSIDESIDLKSGYSEEDYPKLEGKLPLVVTIEIENTTKNYIDIGGFKIVDSNSKDLENSYAEGISSEPVDGINGGQKLTITDVYLANDDKPVSVIYDVSTWK